MKATRGRTAATATIAAAGLFLAACGGGDNTSTPNETGGEDAPSGSMVFGESTDFPENLMPANAAGSVVSAANILVRLLPAPFQVLPDVSLAPDPALVTGEPTSDDSSGKQVVTYELNPDAVWSDGEPITVDDFEYTWRLQRSSDPAAGGCEALVSTTGYDKIESVEAGDGDNTVAVTYATPFSDWKSLFTLYPAHIMDAGDDAGNCAVVTEGWPIATGLPEDISGGPWQLKAENIDAGQQTITLTPNPMWIGEGPHLEALIYQNIGSDPTTQVSGLSSGEINLVNPQPQLDLIPQLQDLEPNVTTQIDFGLSFEHFDLNQGNVHLAKPEVRKAFALALDRTALVSATAGAFDDRAEVLNNRLYVNTQPEYVDNAPEEYNAQDIAAAKELLESVGYVLGADGVYAHPQDGRLELRISTTQNNPLRENTVDIAAAQVADAGFAITKFLDADLFGEADKPTSLIAGGYDIALFAWVSTPFPSSNEGIYKTAGGQNWIAYSNPDVDSLLDQLVTEPDAEAIAQLANDIDTQLWEDMATLPLYQKPFVTAWSSNYEGIEPNPTSAGTVWNSELYTLVQ